MSPRTWPRSGSYLEPGHCTGIYYLSINSGARFVQLCLCLRVAIKYNTQSEVHSVDPDLRVRRNPADSREKAQMYADPLYCRWSTHLFRGVDWKLSDPQGVEKIVTTPGRRGNVIDRYLSLEEASRILSYSSNGTVVLAGCSYSLLLQCTWYSPYYTVHTGMILWIVVHTIHISSIVAIVALAVAIPNRIVHVRS